MWTKNFQIYKLYLEKAEEPEIKLPTPIGHKKKSKAIPEKQKDFCFIDSAKAFNCVDHNKLWKIIKEMGMPDHLTSWGTCMQVKKQQLESDMEQWTGSKLGKE